LLPSRSDPLAARVKRLRLVGNGRCGAAALDPDRDDREREPGRDEHGGHRVGRTVAVAGRDDHAAEVRAERVGDVEGRLDGGRGQVRRTSTPSGDVATTAHYGEYSDMAGAYAALEQWCQDSGRRAAGVNWEVYGDWDDDPAKRRTDVYFLLEAPRRP